MRDKLNPIWQNEMPWAHAWLDADPEYQRRKKRGGDADGLADEAGEPVTEEAASLN